MGRRKYPNDVDLCIAGRCIGWNCPCLCHVETLRFGTITDISSDAGDGFRRESAEESQTGPSSMTDERKRLLQR